MMSRMLASSGAVGPEGTTTTRASPVAGTAETGRGGRDHAWFTCFAPERTPRLVVTVVVEEGGFGAVAALPVARGVLLEAQRLGLLK